MYGEEWQGTRAEGVCRPWALAGEELRLPHVRDDGSSLMATLAQELPNRRIESHGNTGPGTTYTMGRLMATLA